MDSLVSFVGVLLGLVPVVAFAAPLIAFIVDQLKRVILPDGYAPLVAGVLNLAVFAVVYFVGEEHAKDVENLVAIMYNLAPYIVAVLGVVISAPAVHDKLVKAGVGFKHTPKKAAAGPVG